MDLDHDAVLVTHRHRDHFDDAARERLPDDVPLHCQPVEADAFRDEGFTDVRPVDDEATFRDLDLYRTPARHGHGELAEQMAPVSGFVLDGDQRLYEGDPITMDADDVAAVRAHVDDGVPVIADHMDAINHCLLTREDLRAAVDGVTIPADGETVEF